MLDMRSCEEAEGERRMMGSERFEFTFDCCGLVGAGTGRVASVLDCGCPGLAPGAVLRFPRKSSACLRTWEKSCLRQKR